MHKAEFLVEVYSENKMICSTTWNLAIGSDRGRIRNYSFKLSNQKLLYIYIRGRHQLPAFCFKRTMLVWEGDWSKLVRLEQKSAFLDCCGFGFAWLPGRFGDEEIHNRNPKYSKLRSRGGLHGQARVCRRLLQSWLAIFMISCHC